MLALVGVLFGYLETARSKGEKKSAILEADLLRDDVRELLAEHLKNNPSKETLQILYSVPLPIYTRGGEFGMTAQCEPLLNRVPITWLGWEEEPKHRRQYRLARELFDRIAEDAELREPETLYEMIVESLKGAHSVFGEKGSLSVKEGTMNRDVFYALLDDYRFRVDDPNIEKAKWNEYFLLHSLATPIEKLDGDFLTKKLVAYLFDQESDVVDAEYTPGELDVFLRSIGEERSRYNWLMTKKPPPAMHCSIHYRFRELEYNLGFDYRNQRIENFEFQKQ